MAEYITKIRSILSQCDAEKIVYAFVCSRLNYSTCQRAVPKFYEKPPTDPKCCSRSSDDN